MKLPSKFCKAIIFGLGFCAYSTAYSADLLAVFNDAVRHDPVIRAADASRKSQQEAVPQAESGILPTINASLLHTRSREVREGNDTLRAQGVQIFDTDQLQLNLRQPLFNMRVWQEMQRSGAIFKAADATYYAAEQDLIIRVAEAYFAVLQANDTLRATKAELKANERQLEQAQQRFKVGLDAITSVYEAQAEYDVVAARLISDKNTVANNREALRVITNTLYMRLEPLSGKLPLLRPDPINVEKWVRSAEAHNFDYIAARHNAEAAKRNIRVQFAEHLPTASLIADVDDLETFRTFVGTTDQRTGRVGVEIDVPIFQGGLIASRTRQAQYDYHTAANDMESVHRQVNNNTRQSYNNIIAGISAVKADKQAIVSAQSSLESSEAAFKVGTRTIVDVLDAQRTLFDAQRQLAVDQYAYINSTLALKRAAGILNIDDLREINAWLHGQRSPINHHKAMRLSVKKNQAVAAKAKPVKRVASTGSSKKSS